MQTPSTTTSEAEAESSSGAGSSSSDAGAGPSDSTSTGPDPSSEEGPEGSTTGLPAVCGNNVLEETEFCDLNQVNGETCASLGYQGGELSCALNCQEYNLLSCFICGNDFIDVQEECEGDVVPEDVTCESMGFEAGEVTCGDDCLFDFSDCSICGDGITAGPEACDAADLDGQDCMSLGFDEGVLACTLATCTFDVSGCTGGQYLQDFEVGAMPAEFTLGGTAEFIVDGANPIAGSFSAQNGDINDSETSSMSLTVNFAGDGEVSFWHEESSEGNFDYLQFFIDDVLIEEWSGLNPAAMATYPVEAGVHDFEWRYQKDGSVSSNADTVWVDDISMIPGVPL